MNAFLRHPLVGLISFLTGILGLLVGPDDVVGFLQNPPGWTMEVLAFLGSVLPWVLIVGGFLLMLAQWLDSRRKPLAIAESLPDSSPDVATLRRLWEQYPWGMRQLLVRLCRAGPTHLPFYEPHLDTAMQAGFIVRTAHVYGNDDIYEVHPVVVPLVQEKISEVGA